MRIIIAIILGSIIGIAVGWFAFFLAFKDLAASDGKN